MSSHEPALSGFERGPRAPSHPLDRLAKARLLRYGVGVLPSPAGVTFDPVLAAGLVTVGGIVVASARALPGEPLRTWRRWSGAVAVLLLAAAWVSPLQTVASHYLLTAHLVQITLIMGVVPPLLLLAL